MLDKRNSPHSACCLEKNGPPSGQGNLAGSLRSALIQLRLRSEEKQTRKAKRRREKQIGLMNFAYTLTDETTNPSRLRKNLLFARTLSRFDHGVRRERVRSSFVLLSAEAFLHSADAPRPAYTACMDRLRRRTRLYAAQAKVNTQSTLSNPRCRTLRSRGVSFLPPPPG